MHYQMCYSKLASATKDFDFFLRDVACAHFTTICEVDKFIGGCVERMLALCCASLRQIAQHETTGKFWYDCWVLLAGGGDGRIIFKVFYDFID